MFNMVIDGKVPIDLANESIGHFLPDIIKEIAQTALDTCRSSLGKILYKFWIYLFEILILKFIDANGNIHCVVGYNMLKCLAANDLKFFLL